MAARVHVVLRGPAARLNNHIGRGFKGWMVGSHPGARQVARNPWRTGSILRPTGRRLRRDGSLRRGGSHPPTGLRRRRAGRSGPMTPRRVPRQARPAWPLPVSAPAPGTPKPGAPGPERAPSIRTGVVHRDPGSPRMTGRPNSPDPGRPGRPGRLARRRAGRLPGGRRRRPRRHGPRRSAHGGHPAPGRRARPAAPAPPFLGGPVPGSTGNPAGPRRNACLAQMRPAGQPPDRRGQSAPPGHPAEPTG